MHTSKLSFTDGFSGLTCQENKKATGKILEQRSLPIKYFLPLMKSVFQAYTVIRHPDWILRSMWLLVLSLSKSFLIFRWRDGWKSYAGFSNSVCSAYNKFWRTAFEWQDFKPFPQVLLWLWNTLQQRSLPWLCERFKCFHCKADGNQWEVRRMDSMMIESNIRKLRCMELIYTCIAKLSMYVNRINGSALSDDLKTLYQS